MLKNVMLPTIIKIIGINRIYSLEYNFVYSLVHILVYTPVYILVYSLVYNQVYNPQCGGIKRFWK